MSVTFNAENDLLIRKECPFCKEDWADYPEGNGRGGKCDRHCPGYLTVPVGPEYNYSNANARPLLTMLDLGDTDCLMGSCSGDDMIQAIKDLMRKDKTSTLVYKGVPTRLSMEAKGRLCDLMTLACYSRENSRNVVWG